MKLPKINLKNTAIAGGLWYAGLYWLANMPSWLENGISSLANWVWEVVWTTAQATSNVLSNVNLPVIPAFWTAAPFIAPMIAGWWAWKKLTDAMDIQNKTLKNITSVAWVSAWALWAAALTWTAASPFLTIAWTWLWAYYWLKYWAKTIGWTWRILKWAYNWIKTA